MGNARPESEGKQLWRRCPRLRLPNRLARQGSISKMVSDLKLHESYQKFRRIEIF